jgi:hypothetical protein
VRPVRVLCSGLLVFLGVSFGVRPVQADLRAPFPNPCLCLGSSPAQTEFLLPRPNACFGSVSIQQGGMQGDPGGRLDVFDLPSGRWLGFLTLAPADGPTQRTVSLPGPSLLLLRYRDAAGKETRFRVVVLRPGTS